MTTSSLAASPLAEARRWVVDRLVSIASDRRITIPEAVVLLRDEMAPEAGHWWALLGEHCLLDIMAEEMRRTALPDPRAGRVGRSWRESVRSGQIPVWGLLCAVGNTGMLKRYGDLTRADLETIAGFYEKSAQTMKQKAGLYWKVAREVKDGETLEAAAHRLPQTLVTFLQSEGGRREAPDD